MTPLRRFLAFLLVPVVLATGLAAAIHAHAPRLAVKDGVSSEMQGGGHEPGSCATCRLAHESSSAALAFEGATVDADFAARVETPSSRPPALDLDRSRSPRAPPRPALG